MTIVIWVAVGLLVGLGGGFFGGQAAIRSSYRRKEGDIDSKIEKKMGEANSNAESISTKAQEQANRIIADAKEKSEDIKRKKMLEAK